MSNWPSANFSTTENLFLNWSCIIGAAGRSVNVVLLSELKVVKNLGIVQDGRVWSNGEPLLLKIWQMLWLSQLKLRLLGLNLNSSYMKAISVLLLTVRSFYLQPYDTSNLNILNALNSTPDVVDRWQSCDWTGSDFITCTAQWRNQYKTKDQFSLGIKCFHFARFYIRTTFTTKVQYNIAHILFDLKSIFLKGK